MSRVAISRYLPGWVAANLRNLRPKKSLAVLKSDY